MHLTAETRVRSAAHVVTRVVDDTLALLDVNSGAYFSVNEIGVLFMEMSEAGATFGEIAERVASEYEVTEEEALQDLIELAGDLIREGLIEVRASEE
jgi:hypothetical protein